MCLKKIEADRLEVFDNYVVLHYDPDKKASDMTESEKKVAKDPILFGVIFGSDRLYYIGDWIDPDFCDLVWSDIENIFSGKPEVLKLTGDIEL